MKRSSIRFLMVVIGDLDEWELSNEDIETIDALSVEEKLVDPTYT